MWIDAIDFVLIWHFFILSIPTLNILVYKFNIIQYSLLSEHKTLLHETYQYKATGHDPLD